MEFMLYLLSNFCVMAGMLLVFWKLGQACLKGRAAARNELQALNISVDTLVLLCVGALARCYWSFSPPGVWAHETSFIRTLGMLDVFCSLVAHIGLVVMIFVIQYGDDSWFHRYPAATGGKPICWDNVLTCFMNFLNGEVLNKSDAARSRPIYAQALPLAAITFVIAALASYFGLDAFEHPGAFPLTDTFIVFNMSVDMVAMVPQILLLAQGAMMGESRSSTQVTTHFCALLSAARVLRLGFWLALYVLWGEAVTVFILPDVLHTILMGDFLYQWLVAVHRDAKMIL